ncbi:SAM-dependent methyl transferase [Salmonella bongori]|nr:SAM-dependent methyl transferase [Salmonella bongori]
MKPARLPQTVVAPGCWGELPWGNYYREALEQQLNPWFAKMYGFHLLKIGNLSAEINCEACAVSHQVNVSAMARQCRFWPIRYIFRLRINPSMFVCWRILCHGVPTRTAYCAKLTAC